VLVHFSSNRDALQQLILFHESSIEVLEVFNYYRIKYRRSKLVLGSNIKIPAESRTNGQAHPNFAHGFTGCIGPRHRETAGTGF